MNTYVFIRTYSHVCVGIDARCAVSSIHAHTPGHSVKLMRPGIDQNALGDYLTSGPEGRLRPKELWFSIYSCTLCISILRVAHIVHVRVCVFLHSMAHTE